MPTCDFVLSPSGPDDAMVVGNALSCERPAPAQKHDLYIATRDVNKWVAYESKLKLIRVDLYSSVPNCDYGSFDLVIIMLPPSGFSNYEQIIKNVCFKISEAKHVGVVIVSPW